MRQASTSKRPLTPSIFTRLRLCPSFGVLALSGTASHAAGQRASLLFRQQFVRCSQACFEQLSVSDGHPEIAVRVDLGQASSLARLDSLLLSFRRPLESIERSAHGFRPRSRRVLRVPSKIGACGHHSPCVQKSPRTRRSLAFPVLPSRSSGADRVIGGLRDRGADHEEGLLDPIASTRIRCHAAFLPLPTANASPAVAPPPIANDDFPSGRASNSAISLGRGRCWGR